MKPGELFARLKDKPEWHDGSENMGAKSKKKKKSKKVREPKESNEPSTSTKKEGPKRKSNEPSTSKSVIPKKKKKSKRNSSPKKQPAKVPRNSPSVPSRNSEFIKKILTGFLPAPNSSSEKRSSRRAPEVQENRTVPPRDAPTGRGAPRGAGRSAARESGRDAPAGRGSFSGRGALRGRGAPRGVGRGAARESGRGDERSSRNSAELGRSERGRGRGSTRGRGAPRGSDRGAMRGRGAPRGAPRGRGALRGGRGAPRGILRGRGAPRGMTRGRGAPRGRGMTRGAIRGRGLRGRGGIRRKITKRPKSAKPAPFPPMIQTEEQKITASIVVKDALKRIQRGNESPDYECFTDYENTSGSSESEWFTDDDEDRSPRRRSRSPGRRPRVIDHRDRRSPRRSPPRSRLPGPERRDVMPFNPRHSPPKNAKLELSADERDQRTLFIMQIARDTRPRDLEEFFSAVGAVRDVRIITDSRTGRSKGICYVEFWDEDSVPLGLALNGQRLMGAPLIIQRTCSERNRQINSSVANALGFGVANNKGPTKLFVENLHPKISDKMLQEVFTSFGRIESVDLPTDSAGDGTGNAVVLFRSAEDATKAFEQLNNFELAGKCIRLSLTDPTETAKKEEASIYQRSLDDCDNRQGFSLGAGGRQQLMAKLAQGTGGGMELSSEAQMAANQATTTAIPAIATQCFLLSNMFDPASETDPNWDVDIRDDVIEQCAQHGGALHVFVDRGSEQGNVYVKCPSIAIAHQAVSALHGRWFSGKVITANYVPVNSYHELFPDAVHSRLVLQSRANAAAIPAPPMNPAVPGYGYGMMPPAPPSFGNGAGYY